MQGLADDLSELTEALVVPPPSPTTHKAPTVLIIGDSFTGWPFKPMMEEHGGQFAWIPHDRCGFDWHKLDSFHPSEVWWMPTERFMLCLPNVRPKNMPVGPSAKL